MAVISAGLDISADDYLPHSLHDEERVWPEKNCYLDLWIELLHSLELDPLAESIYRRLMELQLHQGRRAEALETYRRCRQILSVVLGLAPCKETEQVHRQIVDGG